LIFNLLYYILLLVLNKKDDLRKRFEKRFFKKVVDFLLEMSYNDKVAENDGDKMNLEN